MSVSLNRYDSPTVIIISYLPRITSLVFSRFSLLSFSSSFSVLGYNKFSRLFYNTTPLAQCARLAMPLQDSRDSILMPFSLEFSVVMVCDDYLLPSIVRVRFCCLQVDTFPKYSFFPGKVQINVVVEKCQVMLHVDGDALKMLENIIGQVQNFIQIVRSGARATLTKLGNRIHTKWYCR